MPSYPALYRWLAATLEAHQGYMSLGSRLSEARAIEAEQPTALRERGMDVTVRALDGKQVVVRVLASETIAVLRQRVQRAMLLKYCDPLSADHDRFWVHKGTGIPLEHMRFTVGPPPRKRARDPQPLLPLADDVVLGGLVHVRPGCVINLAYWEGTGVFYASLR